MNRRRFLKMLGFGALSAPLAAAASHAQPAAAGHRPITTRKACSVPGCARWAKTRGRCYDHLASTTIWLHATRSGNTFGQHHVYVIGPEVVLPINNGWLTEQRFQPGDPS